MAVGGVVDGGAEWGSGLPEGGAVGEVGGWVRVGVKVGVWDRGRSAV